jgi:uncharacterized protein DUF1579
MVEVWMKSVRRLLAAFAVAAAATAFAQESRPSARPEAPAMPTPGPEHAVLKDGAGTWDATVESFAAPGQPPMLAKGIETATMVGGFWLVSDFKSEVMGQPFLGRSTLGYDPAKKKYVSTWIDSMTPSLSVGESDYDAATKTFTGWTDGIDHRGRPTRFKTVTVFKDPATRISTMSMKGPDGKEMTVMRITYTREK